MIFQADVSEPGDGGGNPVPVAGSAGWVERTEFLLRRLQGCQTAEQAAYLIARELPETVGADWAERLRGIPEAIEPGGVAR